MGSIKRAVRMFLRMIAAGGFVGAGMMHFLRPDFFRRIVPPGFPSPATLVAISGFFEIAGGLALLYRPLRKATGRGLIALLIAVFPANIYMVINPGPTAGSIPLWALWLRLPLQAVFIAWIWFVSLTKDSPA